MRSAIYRGIMRHRRHAPKAHAFRYRVYMMYLDLDELPGLFDGRWFWSARRPAPVRFRRADYLGDPSRPLADAVRDRTEEATGRRPTGPIRMLTNLRHFGYIFNPVTFYYCHDPADTRIETIVGEITNTPWKERHSYVLEGLRGTFGKTFHVSPFMPMDQRYVWRFTEPGHGLAVHMENHADGACVFDATLVLRREEITGASLARVLARHPLMTTKVIAGIHWQALRLWLKRCPVYDHPGKKGA